MNPPDDSKVLLTTPPAALINNAAVVTAEIDRLGYDFAQIDVILGATDIALTVLKVQESDTSGSGFADIVGTRFGTDNNDAGSASTLPSATDDNKVFSFFLDLRARKRYLDVACTVGFGVTGAFVTIVTRLWKSKDAPRTAAEAGYSQRMRV